MDKGFITQYSVNHLLRPGMLRHPFQIEPNTKGDHGPLTELIKLPGREADLDRSLNGPACCEHHISRVLVREDNHKRSVATAVNKKFLLTETKLVSDQILQFFTGTEPQRPHFLDDQGMVGQHVSLVFHFL
jgi:hypothetical protein